MPVAIARFTERKEEEVLLGRRSHAPLATARRAPTDRVPDRRRTGGRSGTPYDPAVGARLESGRLDAFLQYRNKMIISG